MSKVFLLEIQKSVMNQTDCFEIYFVFNDKIDKLCTCMCL